MSADNTKHAYLKALGVQVWVDRHAQTPPVTSQAEMEWENLQRTAKSCELCALSCTRTNVVWGKGNVRSQVMFIGEGPGADEDKQGLPFVGRAGQLLEAMLRSIHLNVESVYIANIIKCRPPQNRDPSAAEMAACTPYLDQQITYVKPQLIVALGRVAAHYLLQTKASMAQLRGKLHQQGAAAIPLIVTYHPAYLLRKPQDKAQALQDLYCITDFLQHAQT